MTEWTENPAIYRDLGDLENRTAHSVHRALVGSYPWVLSTYSHRLISNVHCHTEKTVCHSQTILSANHYQVISPTGTTYRAFSANKKKKWRQGQTANDSDLTVSRMSAPPADSGGFPLWLFLQKRLMSGLKKRVPAEAAHLLYVLVCETICSSSPPRPLRGRKWVLVEVHQKHRKYCRGKSMTEAVGKENKGVVFAVSAGKNKYVFFPLSHSVIKVQQEVTARVVHSLWHVTLEQPLDWLRKTGDK